MSYRLISCGECDIQFQVPDYWYQTRKQDGNTWTCRNGHVRVFTHVSENEKLRLERDRYKQQLAQKDDEIRSAQAARDAAEKREKRLKKRVGNGVCPCCTRSFTNLARHMQTKHPNIVKPEIVAEKVS